MRIPLSLIQSFVSLEGISLAQISETLTLLGMEVDGIQNERPAFSHVVVGEVLAVQRHPSADKLQVAEVTDGHQTLQVVCGAANCRAGIKTAFAKVGAVLGERKIEKAKLRGVESNGMLCAADELGLWTGEEGIMELPHEWQNGQDLVPLLWDPVLELSLTPNLGHCLSALGIARELAAALQKTVKRPSCDLQETGERLAIEATVRDAKLCPRYMARRIEGVKVAPSPFWLRKLLLSCGMKSISNVVDVGNYICLKLGQPLHCFDADLLEGNLRIAPAEKTEKFLGLDNVEREVAAGTLMIYDAKKAVAIAGVLGGANSAVSNRTKNILLEAAFFDPMVVRKGAKALGLRTESALRFEKGIDPNGVPFALDEAAALLTKTCGGEVDQGVLDLKKHPFPPKHISYRTEKVNQFLGTKLSQTEMEDIFKRLGFSLHNSKVEVPQYRFDITEEIDLIEEVARIYGYNNIERRAPLAPPSTLPHDAQYVFETLLRKKCLGLGLQEFLTADLISPKLAELAIEFIAPNVSLLKTLHPKTEEYSILRPSLLPGLLQVAKGNIDRKNSSFQAFEIGHVHILFKEKNLEVPTLGFILTGKARPASWDTKPADVDFYDLKGMLETLFESLSAPKPIFCSSTHLSFHPGRQANLEYNGTLLGSLGEVHPNLLQKLDIKERILFAEINLVQLMHLYRPHPQMTPLPQFPSSERDWTAILNLDTKMETIFTAIHSTHSNLLEKVELIDLYQPEGGMDKRATFRFTYRDRLKTISFEEVEAEHKKILAQPERFCKA